MDNTPIIMPTTATKPTSEAIKKNDNVDTNINRWWWQRGERITEDNQINKQSVWVVDNVGGSGDFGIEQI